MIKVVESRLYIGDHKAEDLADRFGTPLYVYDRDAIVENYTKLVKSIPYKDVKVLYSCKANNNTWILRTLRDLGSGLDAVSPWEVLLGIKLGFPRERILFTGNNVSNDELKFVRGELGVLINIDSLSQLKRYGDLFPSTEISIRVNPGIGAGHHGYTVTGGITKFGIYLNQLNRAKKIAAEHDLRVIGVHMHIGSGILSVEPHVEALKVLLGVAEIFGRNLEFIDIGGGFGIPYRPDESPLDISTLGTRVADIIEKFSRKQGHVRLRLEPGRYLVGNAGILLTRVIDVKEVEQDGIKKTFVGTDSGMNHLIRPALYGAYHEIIPVSKAGQAKEVTVDVFGNICESGDILATAIALPKLEEGDVLAIMNAGAYGYSMSSNYNMRPRPAEVMVSGSEVWLTRRRETFEDLLRTSILEGVT